MKVLFSSPFLSFPGHIQRMGVLKAHAMANAGLDVTVLGFPLSYALLPQHERLRYISVQDAVSEKTRRRMARWSRRFGNFWLFLVETCWVQWASLRYARRHGFDIVFVADIEPWLLLPALLFPGIRRRGPKITGYLSFLFNVKHSARQQPWFSRLRSRLNYHAALRLPRYMNMVFDSTYWAAPYNRISSRVNVIPDGYENAPATISREAARHRLGIPEKERVLLHFGVASPGKGTELLIEALRGIPAAFDLYIVGKSGVCGSREGLLDGLSAEWCAHVHLVDRYVSEEERVQYYSACDAIVLPYVYGFLGSSGNFRDAISFGKAILASDQFLMGEITRKYDLGILFKPENVADLRRALVEFSRKPDEWFRGIAERSKAIVEELSWDKIGVRYRELFERLAAEGHEDRRQMTDAGRQTSEDGPQPTDAR